MEPRRLLTAVSASFDPNGPNHSLVYDFDTDVSASLVPADIEALDLKSATRIAPADTSLAFAAGDVATLALGGVTYPAQWGTRAGLLADGNYEAILSEAAVSPPLNDEHRLNFHFYQGDIVGNNGAPADRTININDQSVLFSHWNQPGNYLDGDLNYDGTINFGDYAILASRWGSTLHAPLAAPYAVQVGSQTTDSLLVEWTAPQWPGGATPDGYRIYRSEDGVDFGSTFIAAVAHTPGQSSYAWEDTDLLDGRKYWYRVRAYTTAGGNTHTTEKRWGVTTLKAPTYVTLSYNDDETEAVARWRGGSSHHTGYTVKLYEAPAEDTPLALMTLVQTQQVGASETSHTFTLPQGEHGEAFYFAVVQARNAESSADSAPNVPARAQHDPSTMQNSLREKSDVPFSASDNYIRVEGEKLSRVSFIQYIQSSTWIMDYAGNSIDVPMIEALFGVPPGAPFISTNGEWVPDWIEIPGQPSGPMQATTLGDLNIESSIGFTLDDRHSLGPNPHGIRGGADITFNAGGRRDFKVIFMRSNQNDPAHPIATFEWGYHWDNNSYAWTAVQGAPVQLCASPQRNGIGAAMVGGYGVGTSDFAGFTYQLFVA